MTSSEKNSLFTEQINNMHICAMGLKTNMCCRRLLLLTMCSWGMEVNSKFSVCACCPVIIYSQKHKLGACICVIKARVSNDSCSPNPQYVRTRQSNDFNASQGNKDNLIQCCLNVTINTVTQGRSLFFFWGGGYDLWGEEFKISFLIKVHG